MNKMLGLSLFNASLGYGSRKRGKPVIEKISLTIEKGQWVSIIGPNGGGKSTLLKSLMGILPLMSGERRCDFETLGYVPQKFSVPREFSLSVEEFFKTRHQNKNTTLMETLDLATLWTKPLRELSGGQLQRVLLAFALWNDPKLLALDEYLEGMDLKVVHQVEEFLEKLHKEQSLTVLGVSHDVSSVTHTADRVIVVKDVVLYDGSPRDHGFHDCLHEVYGHHHWVKHVE